jgi:hypothetical protein
VEVAEVAVIVLIVLVVRVDLAVEVLAVLPQGTAL